MHDLWDTPADNVRGTFVDNAGTFTNQELFNALDWGIESPQAFRDRLLGETGNRDEADVRNLFEAYFYN